MAPALKGKLDERGPTVAAKRCVCFASDAAFGHLSPRLMCGMRADCSEEAADFLIQLMRGVCEPGLDMRCQRAVTPDPSPKTLTRPPPILFTPSNHVPQRPVHWPDGCLIKDGGSCSGQTTDASPDCTFSSVVL